MAKDEVAALGSRVADLLDELTYQDIRCQQLEEQLREADAQLSRYQLEISRLEDRLDQAASAPPPPDPEVQAGAALIDQLQRELAEERQRADDVASMTVHTEERHDQVSGELDLAYAKLEEAHQREIDTLKMWLERLEEIEQYTASEIAARDARIAELEKLEASEIQRLRAELAARPTQEQLESLRKRFYAESEQRLAINRQVEDARLREQNHQQTVDRLNAIVAANQKMLDELRKDRENLSKELESLRVDSENRVHEITENLMADREERERESAARVRKAEDRVAALQAAVMEAQDQAKQARSRADQDLKELRSRLAAAPAPSSPEGEVERTRLAALAEEQKAALASIQAEADGAKKKISELETALSEEKGRAETSSAREALLRQLQAVAQKSKERMDQQEQEIRSREESLKSLEELLGQQKQQYESQILELQAKREAERAAARENADRSQPRIDALQDQVGRLTQERDELIARATDLEQSLAGLKPILVRAQQELRDRQARIAELEAQPAAAPVVEPPAARSDLPEQVRRHEERLSRLQEELKTRRSALNAHVDRIKEHARPPVPTGLEYLETGLVRIDDSELTLTRAGFSLARSNVALQLIGIGEKFLRAAVREHLEQGSTLHVKILIRKFGDLIEGEAQVRNEVTIKADERYEVNFTWTTMSEEDRQRLKNAIGFYSSPAGRGTP